MLPLKHDGPTRFGVSRASLPLPLMLVLLAGAFAGCAGPDGPRENETPQADPDEGRAAPPKVYEAVLRVSEETPDGAPIYAAEVYAVDKALMPVEAGDLPLGRYTDVDGALRLVYAEPTTVVVQVLGPGKGEWTREGLTIHIGDEVTADAGFVVSEREVFVPLYRAKLTLSSATTWGPASASIGPDGMVVPDHVTADLLLPEETRLAYLTRLSSARVDLFWNETVTSHAELAAGLAWNGAPWVAGESQPPGIVPASRQATFDGPLPTDGRPDDLGAAQIQPAALTRSAVVGEIPLAFQVTLGFSGHVPAGMPEPLCLSMTCGPLPPLPPLSWA